MMLKETKATKPIYENHGGGTLSFTIKTKINAPIQKVWENVVNPDMIKKYFTVDANGKMDEPGIVTWQWTNETVLIRILDVEHHKKIKFEWNGNNVEYKITCEFTFKEIENNTVVIINEYGWQNNEAGIKSSYENCSGWTEFLDVLKVFTVYDIAFLKD